MRQWVVVAVLPLVVAQSPDVARADDGAELSSDGVVISASRREESAAESAVQTEVIHRAQLEATGAQTLAEALDQLAGVELVREATGAHVRLQGLDPKHTLIVLDGQRLSGRTGGQVDLARIALADIERIEIVRGPSSALYGSDALGGVVHLTTRKGKQRADLDGVVQGAEIAGLYGSGNRRDLSGRLGLEGRHWSSEAQVGWMGRDGWDHSPHDVATQGNAFDEVHGLVRGEWQPSARSRWEGRLQGYWRDQHGVDAAETGAVFDRLQRTASMQLVAGPTFRWETGELQASLQYSLFRDRYVQDQRGSAALDSVQDSREQVGQATLQWSQTLGATQRITAGVDALGEWLGTPRLGDGDAQRQRLAAYAEYAWRSKLGAVGVALLPGARIDSDSQFGLALSPKINAKLDLGSNWMLRLGYGWGFRAPSFQELYLRFTNPAVGYVVQGSPRLKPEVGRGWTAAVEGRPHAALRIVVSGFLNHVEDLIQTGLLPNQTPGMTSYGYLNVAAARTLGVDAQLRWSLPAWKALLPRLEVGGSWLRAHSLDRHGNTADPLVGRPRWRGFVQAALRHMTWKLDASVRTALVGQRPFLQTTGVGEAWTQAPAYPLVEARVAWQLHPRTQLCVQGENLTNAGDIQFLTIAPRTVSVGLRASF